MAGLVPPAIMDGVSVLPLLVSASALEQTGSTGAVLPADTAAWLRGAAIPSRLASFHEYYNQGPWEVGTRHPLDDWSNTCT